MNYISIKQVLDNILDHPLLQDVKFERAVNYAIEFIRLLGIPSTFNEKITELEIKNYKALLPCDFISIVGVRDKCGHSYRYTTDTFHTSDVHTPQNELTYKLQGNILYSSQKEGIIEVAYLAINLDEEGYPMIPDEAAFIRALELYIKKRCFTVLFDMGKIRGDILQNTQQEYAWAVGLAQAHLTTPTPDQMQSITNMMHQLILRTTEHDTQFRRMADREYLRQH